MTTLGPAAKNHGDTTYATMLSTLWSIIESNTGIVCACLPTLKKPAEELWRRVFGGRAESGSEGAGVTGSGAGGGVGGAGWSASSRRGGEEGFRVMGERWRVEVGAAEEVPMGGMFKRTDVRVEDMERVGVGVGVGVQDTASIVHLV